MNGPTIVKNWDSMPPVVEGEGEVFSIRVLAYNYRKMQTALEEIANNGMDAKQCQERAVAVLKDLNQ